MKIKIPISILNFIEDKKINISITELKLILLVINEFNKKYFDEISSKNDKKTKLNLISEDIIIEISNKTINKYIKSLRKNKLIEILDKQKEFTKYEIKDKNYIIELNKTFVRYLILENKGFAIFNDDIFNLKHKLSFYLLLISKKYNNLLLAIDTFKNLIMQNNIQLNDLNKELSKSIFEIENETNINIKLNFLNKSNNTISRGEKAEKVFITHEKVYDFEIFTKMTIQELKDMRLIPLQCDDILSKIKKEYGDFELMIFLLSIKDKATSKIKNIENVAKYTIENHKNKLSEIGLDDFNKRKKFFEGLSNECKEFHKKAVLKNKRIKEGYNEELEFYEYYYSIMEIEEKLLGKTIDGDSLIYFGTFNKLLKEGKEYIKEMPVGRMNLIYKEEEKVNAIPIQKRRKKYEDDGYERLFGSKLG